MNEIPTQFLIPIRKSSNQPLLLLGCEPTWVIPVVMGSGYIFYSLIHKGFLLSIALAAIFFWAGLKVLQMYGSKDPIYIKLYLANLKHKHGFWTALPSAYRGKPAKQ